MNSFLVVVVLVASMIPLPARERYHVPIARDDERTLVYQMPYIDVDVVKNDFGPGPNNLHLVAVMVTQGQRAEIINGTTVRVYVDWADYLVNASAGYAGADRVANGTYIVSNGYAQSRARWTVRYMPDMSV